MTWLVAGAHSLLVEAFFCRRPDENEAAFYRYLLTRNAKMYGVAFSLDILGDVYLVGRLPLSAVTAEEIDRLLGQVLEANPDFKEEAATPVFRWGFGLWSDKYTDPAQLPDGANVSLYSDPANEAQGLWLLERAGVGVVHACAPGTTRATHLETCGRSSRRISRPQTRATAVAIGMMRRASRNSPETCVPTSQPANAHTKRLIAVPTPPQPCGRKGSKFCGSTEGAASATTATTSATSRAPKS